MDRGFLIDRVITSVRAEEKQNDTARGLSLSEKEINMLSRKGAKLIQARNHLSAAKEIFKELRR